MTREGNNYRYKHQQKTKSFSDIGSLISMINKLRKGKSYLIQRGIYLAAIKGRPIDYRVKIQKPGKKWLITGMVGRLARTGFFVTNLCRGGERLTFYNGMKRSLPGANIKKKRNKLRKITFICTEILEKRFPGIRQLGFDFGFDKNHNIWIFEVNTKPQ